MTTAWVAGGVLICGRGFPKREQGVARLECAPLCAPVRASFQPSPADSTTYVPRPPQVRKLEQSSGFPLCTGSAPDRIRTCDLRFRRPTLYPTELRARADVAVDPKASGSETPPSRGCHGERRGWDSNPRGRYEPPKPLSRRLPSASRPPLRTCCFAPHQF